MKKIRLLIIDDNKDLTNIISKYFKKSKYIEVKHIINSIDKDLIKIDSSSYDCVLLDLIMPNKDGFYFLNYMKKGSIIKKVIIMSSLINDLLVFDLLKYNVARIVSKPFDLKKIELMILKLFKIDIEPLNNKKIIISKLLCELGVPPHVKGYRFIKEALCMENKILLAKELYKELSVIFDTTPSKVERNIRTAIEQSINKGNIDVIYSVFKNVIDINKPKPTNIEFIKVLSEKISNNEY